MTRGNLCVLDLRTESLPPLLRFLYGVRSRHDHAPSKSPAGPFHQQGSSESTGRSHAATAFRYAGGREFRHRRAYPGFAGSVGKADEQFRGGCSTEARRGSQGHQTSGKAKASSNPIVSQTGSHSSEVQQHWAECRPLDRKNYVARRANQRCRAYPWNLSATNQRTPRLTLVNSWLVDRPSFGLRHRVRQPPCFFSSVSTTVRNHRSYCSEQPISGTIDDSVSCGPR